AEVIEWTINNFNMVAVPDNSFHSFSGFILGYASNNSFIFFRLKRAGIFTCTKQSHNRRCINNKFFDLVIEHCINSYRVRGEVFSVAFFASILYFISFVSRNEDMLKSAVQFFISYQLSFKMSFNLIFMISKSSSHIPPKIRTFNYSL